MDDRPTFRVVDSAERRNPNAICVTLFHDSSKQMAWFIGPVTATRKGVAIPYLPKSARKPLSLALLLALGRAIVDRHDICVVDPDGLWNGIIEI